MQYDSEKTGIDINKRREELVELSSYLKTIDNDVTMILQSLQWDRKHLVEALPMTSCKYDQNHRIPPDKRKDHEEECYIRMLGYSKEDQLLPEPLDANANTLVTLSKNDIETIIEYAAKVDPAFKRGRAPERPPLSLERLQHALSTDERRALHDAAVSAAPSCHDLNELALLGGDGETESSKRKSRAEILAELRDMKRRRTKYRGAAKSRNYSDVLRGVIATQMEHYSETQSGDTKCNSQNINNSQTEKPKEYGDVYVKKEPQERDKSYTTEKHTRSHSKDHGRHSDKSRDDHRRENRIDQTRHSEKSRDKYKEREKIYDDHKRDRDDRRYRDDRDRYSSTSKERNDRYSDKYEDMRRKEYKNYKSSSNIDSRYKYEDDSTRNNHKSSRNNKNTYKEYDSHDYSEGKHKRYYDYKQDEYEMSKKRIKQEKD